MRVCVCCVCVGVCACAVCAACVDVCARVCVHVPFIRYFDIPEPRVVMRVTITKPILQMSYVHQKQSIIKRINSSQKSYELKQSKFG